MAEPAPLQVDEALDELVNQFADPLSFLRELVQNSLDAGSDEVEIRVVFEPGEDEHGVAVIHIDDWGEGMTREIIDKRLTRLFSSGKDGDMTKIGKFGIGFVSVFAVEPDAVCVDTSREGENWRVLFDKDRQYKLLRRDEPVDGTKIRVFLSMAAEEFPDFSRRAEATVRYWCRHTLGEVRFDGRVINEPLDLAAPCRVAFHDGFSKIVVGHPLDGKAFFGFYNTGLTLIEGAEGFWPQVSFKASSPNLEHTLTRDNVIEDEGYARVVETVKKTLEGALCAQVFEQLQREVTSTQPTQMRPYYYRAASWHAARTVPKRIERSTVFVSPSGKPITLQQCREDHSEDEVLHTSVRSHLTDALEATGRTVLMATLAGGGLGLAERLVSSGVKFTSVSSRYAMPLHPRDDAEAETWRPLARAVWELVSDIGGKLSSVVFGHFAYPESAIASRVAVTQREFGQVSELQELGELGTGLFSRRRVLVVNADHPTVNRLLQLSRAEPQFAAYLVTKLFFLGARLDADLDGRLAASAMQRRWQNSRS